MVRRTHGNERQQAMNLLTSSHSHASSSLSTDQNENKKKWHGHRIERQKLREKNHKVAKYFYVRLSSITMRVFEFSHTAKNEKRMNQSHPNRARTRRTSKLKDNSNTDRYPTSQDNRSTHEKCVHTVTQRCWPRKNKIIKKSEAKTIYYVSLVFWLLSLSPIFAAATAHSFSPIDDVAVTWLLLSMYQCEWYYCFACFIHPVRRFIYQFRHT